MNLHDKLTILNLVSLTDTEKNKTAQILEILGTPSNSADKILKQVNEIYLRNKVDEDIKKYKRNQELYKKKVERNIIRGEEFKKKLKVGMLVKFEGTNDRSGLRLIERLENSSIVGRKVVVRQLRNKPTEFILDDIITFNGYEKVVNIVSEKPKIKNNRVIF